VYVAPYVLGLILVVALINTFSNFGRARRAPYYRIRRDSSRSGWRWVLVGLVCAGGLYGVLSVRGSYGPPDLTTLFPTPNIGPTPTFDVDTILTTAPGTPAPTRNPLLSPPTITPTQAPVTPSATPFIATIESPVTSSPDATFKLTAISTGISSSLEPVDAGTFFSSGQPRIYVFFTFSNMADGQSWSQVLLLDGNVIRNGTDAWNLGDKGPAYYRFEAPGGFPQGSYQIQLYIGDKLAAQGAFTLR
jgi:hypothetical protein